MKRSALLVASCAAICACASGPVLVGPRPPAADPAPEVSRGSGCGLLLFGIIPIRVNSRTERAYRDALGGRGFGLADTEIQQSWYWIPEIGTVLCTSVAGRVVP